MNILVTGFENFMGSYNPTQDIARALNGQHFFGVQVTGIVIPVSWGNAWKTVEAHIDESMKNGKKYDAVINFGLDSMAQGIQLETIAHNNMNGTTPGADSKRAKVGKIYSGLPTNLNTIKASLPITYLFDQMAAVKGEEKSVITNVAPGKMLVTTTSIDAGDYLCNFTFFNNMYQYIDASTYQAISKYKGFIHVTGLGGSDAVKLADIQQSAAYVIKQVAKELVRTAAQQAVTDNVVASVPKLLN